MSEFDSPMPSVSLAGDTDGTKECFSEPFIRQKVEYMHKNPVSSRWNLASDYLSYPHSSARFYDLNEVNEHIILTHFQDV